MTHTLAFCVGSTRTNPAAKRVFAIDEVSAKLSLQPKVKKATVFGPKTYKSKRLSKDKKCLEVEERVVGKIVKLNLIVSLLCKTLFCLIVLVCYFCGVREIRC